jgi:hypothetical protein
MPKHGALQRETKSKPMNVAEISEDYQMEKRRDKVINKTT